MRVSAVMTKVAVEAPAAIVTEVGVVRRALLSASVTVVAEVAAFVKVTVQVLEEERTQNDGSASQQKRVSPER